MAGITDLICKTADGKLSFVILIWTASRSVQIFLLRGICTR